MIIFENIFIFSPWDKRNRHVDNTLVIGCTCMPLNFHLFHRFAYTKQPQSCSAEVIFQRHNVTFYLFSTKSPKQVHYSLSLSLSILYKYNHISRFLCFGQEPMSLQVVVVYKYCPNGTKKLASTFSWSYPMTHFHP